VKNRVRINVAANFIISSKTEFLWCRSNLLRTRPQISGYSKKTDGLHVHFSKTEYIVLVFYSPI